MAECKHRSEVDHGAEITNKDEKQFMCSICIGFYRNPRYLPTCGHTFCETCLLKYVNNLQQERQGSKFGCPVCRKPTNLPEHDEVTLQWIQTFPLNTVIIKMMESVPQSSEAMKEERKICDPCRKDGEANNGVKFCLDCKEVLCKTCTKYHKNFKLLEGHKLIDMSEMTAAASQADFFTGVGKCPEHPERDVEIYCKTHDDVICFLCSRFQHKTCELTEIAKIDVDVLKLQKNSEVLSKQMEAAIEHLNVLQNLKMGIKTNLKEKLIEIRENIQHVRDQVVELMDRVVSHVTDVTKQIEIEKEDSIDTDIRRVTKLKDKTEEKVALLETIRQHGSEKHKFVSSHLIEKQCEETTKQISEEDRNLKQLSAELVVTNNLRRLIGDTDVEKLVQIKVTEGESSHTPLAGYNNLRESKLFKDMEFQVRMEDCSITSHIGVAMHQDGRVILSGCTFDMGGDMGDKTVTFFASSHLCLYNPANRSMISMSLANRMRSSIANVVQIDDSHIAVSVPEKKNISIVTVGNSLKVDKTLKTQNTPNAIVALNDGQLAVVWAHPSAFGVINVKGTEIVQKSYLDQDTTGRKFKSFEYLAIDERRQHVMQPCSQDVALYCFDFTGKPVFKYKHRGLKRPRGVALDKCGNIYVCEFANNSIHKVSPEGEPISVFTKGVPSNPLAICSDNAGTGFWLTRGSCPLRDVIVHFRLENDNTEP